jgi:hypothetical protein
MLVKMALGPAELTHQTTSFDCRGLLKVGMSMSVYCANSKTSGVQHLRGDKMGTVVFSNLKCNNGTAYIKFCQSPEWLQTDKNYFQT